MNSTDDLTDNEVAFAAINLFANAPIGIEPGWQDIHDWHIGALEAVRADQVLSHVANNPECFQMWRDICEAAELLEQNPLEEESVSATASKLATETKPAAWDLVGWLRKSIKAIFGQPLPAIGGAVAATLFAIMVVPKLMTSASVNPGDLVINSLAQYSALGAPLPQTALTATKTRSMASILGNMSETDVEKHQFNYGLKEAFDSVQNKADAELVNWLPWRQSLPELAIDCTLAIGQSHCNEVSTDMSTLGQWALVNHLACANEASLPADFQKSQTDIISALKKLNSMTNSVFLAPALAESSDNVCALADRLITMAAQ